jgi:hypothetical protein
VKPLPGEADWRLQVRSIMCATGNCVGLGVSDITFKNLCRTLWQTKGPSYVRLILFSILCLVSLLWMLLLAVGHISSAAHSVWGSAHRLSLAAVRAAHPPAVRRWIC